MEAALVADGDAIQVEEARITQEAETSIMGSSGAHQRRIRDIVECRTTCGCSSGSADGSCC